MSCMGSAVLSSSSSARRTRVLLMYSVTVTLAPGIYEYKFVINGVWTLDPDPDRDWTQNGLGTLNSVLRVG